MFIIVVFLLYEKTRRVEKEVKKYCESGGFDVEIWLISENSDARKQKNPTRRVGKIKNSLPTDVSRKAIDYFFCFVPSGG